MGAETLNGFAVRWHVLSLCSLLGMESLLSGYLVGFTSPSLPIRNSLNHSSTVQNNISGTLP